MYLLIKRTLIPSVRIHSRSIWCSSRWSNVCIALNEGASWWWVIPYHIGITLRCLCELTCRLGWGFHQKHAVWFFRWIHDILITCLRIVSSLFIQGSDFLDYSSCLLFTLRLSHAALPSDKTVLNNITYVFTAYFWLTISGMVHLLRSKLAVQIILHLTLLIHSLKLGLLLHVKWICSSCSIKHVLT